MGEMYSRVPAAYIGTDSEPEPDPDVSSKNIQHACDNTPGAFGHIHGHGHAQAERYVAECIPGRCINVPGSSPPRIAFLAGSPSGQTYIHWPDARYTRAITTGSECCRNTGHGYDYEYEYEYENEYENEYSGECSSRTGPYTIPRHDYCIEHSVVSVAGWYNR